MAVRKGCVNWAIILSTVALIILFSSLLMPWWGFKVSGNYKYSSGDTGYEERALGFGPYSQGLVSGYIETGDYISELMIIVFFSVVTAIVCLTIFILIAILFLSGTIRGISLQLFVLSTALLLCIATPLVFMFAFPSVYTWGQEWNTEQDGDTYTRTDYPDPTNQFFGENVTKFEGRTSSATVTQTWGPDLGWFLPLLSALLLVVSIFLVILGRRREDPPLAEDSTKENTGEEKTQPHTYGPDISSKPEYESEEKPVYHPPQDEEEEKELYERLKKKYETPEKNLEKSKESRKKPKRGIDWEEEDTPSKEPKEPEKDEWDALDEDEWETVAEEEPPAPKKGAKRYRDIDDT